LRSQLHARELANSMWDRDERRHATPASTATQPKTIASITQA